jgi:hypothetical protein
LRTPYVIRQVGAALHDPLGGIGRLWPTHRKNAACAGVPQSLDGSVRVLRGIHDMRPIDERCDPAIKRREPPDQVSGVNVFRPHNYAELEEVIGKVLCRAPVCAQLPETGLPGMSVCFDEAWRYDEPAGIHHFRRARVEVLADRSDLSIRNEGITPQVGHRRIHGDDISTTEKDGIATGDRPGVEDELGSTCAAGIRNVDASDADPASFRKERRCMTTPFGQSRGISEVLITSAHFMICDWINARISSGVAA